jgi:CRISPR/Cas system-associated exonuclease Cas4 (RecB family)
MVFTLLLLIGLVVLFFVLKSTNNKTKLHYIDSGTSSRIFHSKEYRISSKPDTIESDQNGNYITREYKSRVKNIYHSDRQQVIASAIALREEGFDVRRAIIQTRDGTKHPISLDQPTAILYKSISDVVNETRKAVTGVAPQALPSVTKCRHCSFHASCPHSSVS